MAGAQASADALAAHSWWRTERQTVIPLPERQQAEFTIQVHTQPLPQAIATPEDAQRLQAALVSMSAAVLAYRALTPARERLLQWLTARGSQPPAATSAH